MDIDIGYMVSVGYFVLGMSLAGAKISENKLRYLYLFIVAFIGLNLPPFIFEGYMGSTIEPYISIAVMLLGYSFFFKTSIIKSATYMFVFYIFLLIIELTLLLAYNMFSITLEMILTNKLLGYYFELVKWVFVIIILKFVKIRDFVAKQEKYFVYIIAAISNIFLIQQTTRIMSDWFVNKAEPNYFYFYGLLFAILVVNVLLVRSIIISQRQINDVKNYKEFEKLVFPLIERSRSIEHEFKNQLATLKTYINQNDSEINSYITDISNTVSEHNKYMHWSNPVLGAFMQERYEFANANDINFDVKSFDSQSTPNIMPYEILIVLSNLVNNAFEEVLKQEKEYRYVMLKYVEDDEIKINITNSLAEDIAPTDKMTKAKYSTKGADRGYGLANVKKLVKKYDGEINIFHKESEITFDVILKPQAIS